MKIVTSLDEIQSKGNILLYFSAPWCVPCQALAPVMDQAEQDNPHITFLKVDTAQTPKIAQVYRVMSIPVLIMTKDGDVVDQKISPTLDEVEEILSSI